jgi:hypothetical protein
VKTITIRIWRVKLDTMGTSLDGNTYQRWDYSFTVDGEAVDHMASEVAGAVIGGIQALANTHNAEEISYKLEVPE